jgi:protease-4
MSDNSNASSSWEQQTIKDMLFASVKEQRRARRWGIFFKLLIFIYFLLLIIPLWVSRDGESKASQPHVALVDISGVIMPDSENDADNIVTSLSRAFKSSQSKAVILRINSPGGTPVQAAYVYNAIKRLQTQHPDKKLYAVCADMCLSGGYYIASAADAIYANPSSLVGSIGVIISGFGFVDTLEKLGIERRLLTAGDNKAMLDPFTRLSKESINAANNILEDTYRQFIQSVQEGRGARLQSDPEIYSGIIYSGDKGKRLGLVDDFKSAKEVANDLVELENIVDYTLKPSWLEQLSMRMGAAAANTLADRMLLQTQHELQLR